MRFEKLGSASDFPPGSMKRFLVRGVAVLVVHLEGAFYAIADTCTHQEASLGEGFLDKELGVVECPLHGARFDARTGRALSLPAVASARSFPIKLEGGCLFVAI